MNPASAQFKIGSHISSSGGFLAMAKTAESIGANVFQFFTRNPRGGAAKAWLPADIEAYIAFAAERGIGTPLGHAPYTLNPAAEKENVREFARETLRDDLLRLEQIPGAMYNLHPGSHVGQGVDRGIELIAECLNFAVEPKGTVPVLLETMAGKGSEIGGRFEELRRIIDSADAGERLGVCFDTCHVYDAGYDIARDLDGVLSEFDRVVGLARLRAVHLNDSKYPFASHHDRHEKLAEGTLGIDVIAAVINHPALRELPFYLETPNELPGYAREIELLRSRRQ
ncbi:MAG: deoxyribonuclease IV [Oscillospiraceae bacterium]|jgi:deoxyribonuclease-4|nr:deoxyribonuclease IV [Oscillospiraceae bacterium]